MKALLKQYLQEPGTVIIVSANFQVVSYTIAIFGPLMLGCLMVGGNNELLDLGQPVMCGSRGSFFVRYFVHVIRVSC
jgi:hypothetical protein